MKPVRGIDELKGLWRRSLIAWPGRESDTTTSVYWLQGSRAFVDLRQPANGPGFAAARCLADLSRSDCMWLAGQQGFAGQLVFDGRYFEWRRSIDFQAESAEADVGSLEWDGDLLIEKGRDSEYVEHWHRESPERSPESSPAYEVALTEDGGGATASLLRIGSFFMFARDRSIALPARQTLSECVADAPSLEHARELVNCEISFGSVSGSEFRIVASSLPYRVGDLLNPQISGRQLTTLDRTTEGAARVRTWTAQVAPARMTL